MAKKPAEDKIDYVKDIQSKSIQQIASEEVEIPDETVDKAIEEVEEEKTKVEEKAEEIVEEKKEEIEEVDIEEVKKEWNKQTADKLSKALLGEDAPKEESDELSKFTKETWEKEGRNPTYKEALEFLTDKSIEKIEARQAEKVKEEQDRVEEQKKAESERETQLNQYIDSELDDLIKSGKLPAIVDKSDDNDAGKKARKAIFTAMMEVNEERAKEGKAPIYSPAHYLVLNKYKDPNKQPAGDDAPVSGGRAGTHAGDDSAIKYGEIHNKSFFDLLRGK